MLQINASIVLYHNKKEQLIKAIESFLNTDLDVKLYLVDNIAIRKSKILSFCLFIGLFVPKFILLNEYYDKN